MPELRCPFVTCQHNDSHTVQQPGLCTYTGTLKMTIHDDEEADDVFLACEQYARARGKRLIDTDCVAIRGTRFYPVDLGVE